MGMVRARTLNATSRHLEHVGEARAKVQHFESQLVCPQFYVRTRNPHNLTESNPRRNLNSRRGLNETKIVATLVHQGLELNL